MAACTPKFHARNVERRLSAAISCASMSPFRLAILAALALCLPVRAADVLPSAGKAVGFVRDDTPGFWLVLSADLSPVDAKFFEGDDAKGYRGCVFDGGPGRYMAIKIENGRPKTFPVLLGGVAPTPIPPQPVPPGPTPVPPKPEPTPPPIPAGPRTVLILRESANDTPAMSRLLVSLQAGKGRDYLKSKGHSCLALDVDAKGADGKADANVAAWRVAVDVPLPALAILDSKGNVLHKEPLPATATADDVLAVLRRHE